MITKRFILTSFILMFMMGSVYAYSVIRLEVEGLLNVTTVLSGLPYMLSLFFYALAMMLTGFVLESSRIKKIMLIGSVMIVLGWGLSYFAKNILMLSFSYGFLMGFGVGMVYGVPLYIVNQKTEKAGFYNGLILSGFGLSPLLFSPFMQRLIEMSGLALTFLIMSGLSLLVFCIVIAFTDYKLEIDMAKTRYRKPDFSVYFLGFYVIFMLAIMIGLLMIGLTYSIGVYYYGFNARTVALSISLFAVLNGIARPLFGFLIDRYGFFVVSKMSFLLLFSAAIIGLYNQGQSRLLFQISMGIFWFNLGAWLAMLPCVKKRYFSPSNYAANYGFLFTAYGLAAIIGTSVSGLLLDLFKRPYGMYGMVLGIVIIILLISLSLQKFLVNKIDV